MHFIRRKVALPSIKLCFKNLSIFPKNCPNVLCLNSLFYNVIESNKIHLVNDR